LTVASRTVTSAYDMTHKVGLYVEGVRIAFTSAQLMIEDGVLPKLAFSVPATPEMRRLNQRARVHLIVQEPVRKENVVMFEGEIQSRGFAKTSESRELSFTAGHVLHHFDAYEITALDQISYLDALMNGEKDQSTVLGSATGNMLEYFTPPRLIELLKRQRAQEVVPELRTIPKDLTERDLSISQFIIGAFLLYDQIFSNSRLKETYTYDAVHFHQLISRVRGPSVNLLRWNDFYTELMTSFLTTGLQQIGGRMTFFDLIRTVCQNFLYQVSVIPNAESFTKQLQIKPLTHFNAIPRCNVIFPCMSTDYQFQEHLQHKPTRLRTVFLPPTVPNADPNAIRAIRAHFTVFAPTELQYRWREIVDKSSAASAQQAAAALKKAQDEKDKDKTPVRDAAGRTPPALPSAADNLPFLTLEEDRRGIVASDYTLPPLLAKTLLTNILRQPSTTTISLAATISPTATPEEAAQRVYEILRGSEPKDALTRFYAFMCMALGDGDGLDRKRFSKARAIPDAATVPFPQAGKHVKKVRDTATGAAEMVPNRFTVMTLPTVMNAATSLRNLPDEARVCGANYVVGQDGTIFETGTREYRLFQESTALPFGIRIQDAGAADAKYLNSQIPPRGTSFNTWIASQALVVQGPLWVTSTPGAPRTNTFTLRSTSTHVKFVSGSLQGANNPLVAALSDLTNNPATLWVEGFGPATLAERARVTGFSVAGDAFTFTLDRAVIPRNTTLYASLRFDKDLAFNPAKPFFVLDGAAAGKPVAISAKALNDKLAVAATSPTLDATIALSDREVSGGPTGNLVIAACLSPTQGTTLTPAQIEAIGYLVAAVRGLNAERVATAAKSVIYPAGFSETARVRLVQDHYGNASPFPRARVLDAGARQAIESKAKAYEKLLLEAFLAWDREIAAASVDTTGVLQNVDPTAASANNEPPLDPASAPDAGSTSVRTAAPTVEAVVQSNATLRPDDIYKKGELNRYVENYIAAFLNVQFQLARVATQSFTGECAFNPYATVGYPCLILDTAKVGYDLVGYLHAASYSFTPESARCSFTYTHLRQATVHPGQNSSHPSLREPLIPFKKPITNQLLYIMPENVRAYRTVTELELHLRKTYPELVIPSSHLPIQLLGVRRSATDNASRFSPPPFMYNGSWGLKDFVSATDTRTPDPMQAASRDFSMYAVTVGYNAAENNMTLQRTDPAGDQHFIFADTLTQMDAVRDHTLAEAYKYVYRGIQRVGQNSLTRGQASVVDWAVDPEIHSDVPDPHAVGTAKTTTDDPTHAAARAAAMPDYLTVYAASPTVSDKGTVVKQGRPLQFDVTLQAAVEAHNDRIRGNRAFRDGDGDDTA
jgi:hypothetical protein